MNSVVVIEYTGRRGYYEMLSHEDARNSRHRQYFLCSSLSNYKLVQIFHKLKNILRGFLHIGGNHALLDEESEAQTCGHQTSRILPHASKQISLVS